MIHSLLAPVLLCVGIEAPKQHAAFHPAAVDVFIESADVAALVKAYEKAPVVQLLNDPGTGKIADVAKELGFDVRQTVAGMLPVADASRPNDRFWPWSAATAASLSLSELNPKTTSTEPPPKFGRGVIVVDFKDASAAEQALKAAIATGGVERDVTEVELSLTIDTRKAPVTRLSNDEFGRMWVAVDGARLIGGFGGVEPAELTKRLASPETSFLEKHKQAVDDASFKPACGTVVARAWSELERLPKDLLSSMSATEGSLVNTLVPGFLPFVGQKGRYRMQLCGDRFVSESLVERIGDAKELDQLYGSGEIPNTTARMVPKDAIGAWVMKIQPAQFEALLERTIAGMDIPAAAKAGDTGPKLSDALGDSAAMYLMPLAPASLAQGGGGVPAPPAVLAVALKDGAAFKTALESWIARARLADPKHKVENKPYRKLPMYTFTLGDDADEEGAGAESSMKPTITILADRVIVAPNRKTAQGEVRRMEQPANELHAIAAEGAIPKGAYEASTMDWGAGLGKLYDFGRNLVPMLSQGRETPIDVESLPTASTLFRFFRPSASYSQRLDGKTYSYSESSFGPEVPLALALSMIGFTRSSEIMMSGGIEPVPAGVEPVTGTPKPPAPGADDKPAAQPERESTVRALRSVRTGIAIYKSQFQKAPSALDDLVKGTDAFPKGFLEGPEVPKDGWGRALVYVVRDNGAKYDLRSVGANGVDDQGTGDDVLLP